MFKPTQKNLSRPFFKHPYYLKLLVMASLTQILGCAKQVISEEQLNLKIPKIQAKRTLNLTHFVNHTGNQRFNALEITIPELLQEKLKALTTITLKQNSPDIQNIQTIVHAQKTRQKQNSKSLNNILESLTDKSPLTKIPTAPPPQSNTPTLQKINQEIQDIQQTKQTQENYWHYYQSKKTPFKKYLGIEPESRAKVVFRTFQVSIGKQIKQLSSRNIFDIQMLDKESQDLTLLGKIKPHRSRPDQLTLEIRLYDKKNMSFILKKEFSIQAGLTLEKEIDELSTFLKEQFGQMAKGTLNVTSEPKKAYLFLNKKMIGQTNLNQKTAIGFYKLEALKKGYPKWSKTIYISKNTPLNLHIAFKKTKKGLGGTIKIDSIPPKADVFIDLDFKGQTPLRLQDLATGQYKLRLEKEGYQFHYGKLFIQQGQSQTLNIPLKPGKTQDQSVEEHSKDLNWVKNVFFYTTLISTASVLVAYLQTDKYLDKITVKKTSKNTQDSTQKKDPKTLGYENKYQRMKRVRNIAIGSTVGSLALTILFQMLELQAENIQVGITPATQQPQAPTTPEKSTTQISVRIGF